MQDSIPNFKHLEPIGSETEDFFSYFPMYFYATNPEAPGVLGYRIYSAIR